MGIQKFVDKLNIYFKHNGIFTKTSHIKHSLVEHLHVINQINSGVHTKVTVTITTCICGSTHMYSCINVYFLNEVCIKWYSSFMIQVSPSNNFSLV